MEQGSRQGKTVGRGLRNRIRSGLWGSKTSQGVRGRFRTVVFASRRAQLAWGFLGAVALLGGYLLAEPSFESAPSPPPPWGLWVGTNQSYERSQARLLLLALNAKDGCGEPVTATGTLAWHPENEKDLYYRPKRPATRLVLGIANANVIQGEVLSPGSHGWHPMHRKKHLGTNVLWGRLSPWREADAEVKFRVQLDVSSPAGYEACHLLSPVLFEFQGADPVYVRAASAFEAIRGTNGFGIDDAVMWLKIPGLEPDLSALDAGARVRRGRVVVTCTGVTPTPGHRFSHDPYFYQRRLVEESSCGSVQTFRAADAASSLNRHLFLAGILVSAAVALLIEGFLTGKAVSRRSERAVED